MIIYKYPTDLYTTAIIIPKHSKLLKVAMQHGKPTFWFEHITGINGPPEEMLAMNLRIQIVGTGQHFDTPATFVYYNTIFDSALVWHIYVDSWILNTTYNL